MPYTLIYGNDFKLLKNELENLEQTLIKENPGLEVISLSDNATLQIALDEITSSSLFSSRQLLKIHEIEKLNWIDKLLEYDTDIDVILTSYKETNPIKSKKKIQLICVNLPRNYELEKTIPVEFKNQISPEAVEYLSKNISSILDINELKEIMKENQITYLDLETIYKIKGDTEAKIFLIIDDIIQNKISAISEIHEFLESGGYIGQILNLLGSQIEKLYTIKKMQEERINDKEITEKLKITPFIYSKFKKTLQLYTLRKLESLLLMIPKIDYQIRYYDKNFSHYFLEKLILDMTEK